MKKIIIVLLFSFMLFFPSSFHFVEAYDGTKTIEDPVLHVGVFGASMLGGLRSTGFILANYGDESINDIQWVFSIKSVSNDKINVTYSGEFGSLDYNQGYQYTTSYVKGFGFVKVSITATSSNADESTETMKGFQIGPYTLGRSLISAWY